MFRRLGRQFRQLISLRELNLEQEILQRLKDPEPFRLDEGQFYLQLSPLSAEIEDAKLAARGEMPEDASIALYEHFTHRLRPQTFVRCDQIPSVVQYLKGHQEDCKIWLGLADQAQKRNFKILQDEPFPFAAAIDWYSDLCGKSFPFGHVNELESHFDFEIQQQALGSSRSAFANANPPGPIERAFLLNQLNHFIDLARGYWISGNEAYVSEYVAQIIDWADKNPPMYGVAWLHPRGIAHRARNLTISFLMMLDSPQLRNENSAKVLGQILVHGSYLSALLEKGCRDQLAVASSLYILAAHFPEFVASRRWLVQAQRGIEEGQAREFTKDGFHRSGSFSALRESIEWLLLVCWLDQLNSRSWAPLLTPLETALEALLYLKSPTAMTQDFGPVIAEGIFARGFGIQEHIRRLLALGALVLQRPELNHGQSEAPAELVWWAGLGADERLSQLGRREPTGVRRLFQESNLAVCRDNWSPRASWCRLIGRRPNTVESYLPPPPARLPYHDDALGLSLVVEGEPVLLDPGGPGDFSNWAEVFSSAGLHSSPRVGKEIEPFDVVTWSNEPPSPASLESVKDGYLMRAARQVWFNESECHKLRRELLFLPKRQRLVIRDTFHLYGDASVVSQDGDVHFETNLLLAPHLDVLMRGDMGCLLRGKKLQARIIPLFPSRFRYEMLKGRQEPAAGWYWHESGRAAPTNQLRYFGRFRPPFSVVLWFAWNPEDTLTPRMQDVDKLFGTT